MTSFLHIETDRARKAAYVRAAAPGKLMPWALRHLDTEAGHEEPYQIPAGPESIDPAGLTTKTMPLCAGDNHASP